MTLTPSPMVRSGSAAFAINGKLAAIEPAATALAVVPMNSRRLTPVSCLRLTNSFVFFAIFIVLLV